MRQKHSVRLNYQHSSYEHLESNKKFTPTVFVMEISTPGIFCGTRETERLTLIDFDDATFNDRNYNPQLNKEEAQDGNASFMEIQERDDNEMLWSTNGILIL